MSPRLLLYCGAGVDVDSGIPAFSTGNSALWANYSLHQVCNITNWKASASNDIERSIIWDFYKKFRLLSDQAVPSDFHYYIANLVKTSPYQITIITSNVSHLFERAGVPEDRIIHIHGSILFLRCQICNNRQPFDVSKSNEELNNLTCQNAKCSKNSIKPDVVFYGEENGLRYKEGLAAFDLLKNHLDIMIMAGSSGHTFTQALYKWRKKKCDNVKSIQINPDESVCATYKAHHTFSSCAEALTSPILQKLSTFIWE